MLLAMGGYGFGCFGVIMENPRKKNLSAKSLMNKFFRRYLFFGQFLNGLNKMLPKSDLKTLFKSKFSSKAAF